MTTAPERTTPPPVERKYVLTKIASGDYLLPSNDGRTIWRITRYTDGPSHGLDEWPRDQNVWGIWRWASPVHERGYVPATSWDQWEAWDLGMYRTRADAVKAALRTP